MKDLLEEQIHRQRWKWLVDGFLKILSDPMMIETIIRFWTIIASNEKGDEHNAVRLPLTEFSQEPYRYTGNQ